MSEPAKLKAVAERLNLSQSTVSRALNDYRDIALDTKRLVREAANELGYVPNKHARRLASGKSETMAYVVPWRDGQLAKSFLSELIAGMSGALSVHGWDLAVLAPQSTDEEVGMFKRIARTRHISGLVISRTFHDDERFEILRRLKVPFVAHGRSSGSGDAAWLDVDNERAFSQMTQHLVELGHRSIAHIAGPQIYNFAVQRAHGWRRGLREAGIVPAHDWLQPTELNAEGGKSAMQKLLALKHPPSGVCCVSDFVAIGAMQAIREAGFVPGREVSLIGYDGLEIGAWLEPPLTTMSQPLQSAGCRLAEMLIDIVDGARTPGQSQELFHASLVRRGTAGPPMADWPPARRLSGKSTKAKAETKKNGGLKS